MSSALATLLVEGRADIVLSDIAFEFLRVIHGSQIAGNQHMSEWGDRDRQLFNGTYGERWDFH